MSEMTRRKFLKRTGAATVSAIVACNLAANSAKANPYASLGTGSSYRLKTSWPGGFYGFPKVDSYKEVWLTPTLITRRGAEYQAKLKTWTYPAEGVDKSNIRIQFKAEYWQTSNVPGAAPGRQTAEEMFEAFLPNPYSNIIDPRPVSPNNLHISSEEGYGPDWYCLDPTDVPSWMETTLGFLEKFPATAIPAWIPKPGPGGTLPAGTYVVEYWCRPYLRVSPHSVVGLGPIKMDTYIETRFQDRERVIYYNYWGVQLHDTGWAPNSLLIKKTELINIESEIDMQPINNETKIL